MCRTPSREQVAGYVEMARGYEPEDARYLMNHRGHFVFVKPEERRFVTAELIRATTFTATEQELKQRVEAMRDAGWSQIVFCITPGEERAIEDFAPDFADGRSLGWRAIDAGVAPAAALGPTSGAGVLSG